MNQQQNVLSFTVNESLHMEAGQEIEEMLSISIDPDIAIETFEEYMQIRGLIILQGEYTKAYPEPNESNKQIDEHNSSIVYMEKVIDTQLDQMMFSHRFPVEVSVAKNRVENLADVKVEVVSFDYELPANDRLNIEATLHIHGIKADNAQLEQTKQSEQEQNENEAQTIMAKRDDISNNLNEDNVHTVNNEHTVENETDITGPIEHEQEQQAERVEALQDDSLIISASLVTEDDQEIDIQLNETTEETEDEEINDVLFLTDLFGEAEETSVTTMRIHIIQEEDTIESIAKRYDMSALQLMKDNNIHADDMEPGSLIYIANK